MEGGTDGETVACGSGGRELESVFERNMATRVSERLETSAICKNNLSNYEERVLASASGVLYCTPISLNRSWLLDPPAVDIQMQPYIASDNVIPENRLGMSTVFYKDGWFCQYPRATCAFPIPQQKYRGFTASWRPHACCCFHYPFNRF